MALPKRRHSSTRRDKRRAQWKLAAPASTRCQDCGAAKRPHFICPSCGQYGSEKRIETET